MQDSDLLREALRVALNGEAIIFVGAGASKEAVGPKDKPLPVGNELSDALASECGLEDGYDLQEMSEYYMENRSETALINTLRKLLQVKSLSDSYKKIFSVPWTRIWTTNYDGAIELALEGGNVSHYSVSRADSVDNARGNRLLVVHINGSLAKLSQSLTSDFVLTSKSYATAAFTSDLWGTVFRNDLQSAKAIVFVGYSLSDIDIARLLFNPEHIAKKTHFIDHPNIDPLLEVKLRKFGMVHKIGTVEFAQLISEQQATWRKPDFVETYQCWDLVTTETSVDQPSDEDVYELVLKGVARNELLLAQSESPSKVTYYAQRHCELDCIRHLDASNSVALLVGGFANGKTTTMLSIVQQLASKGRDVFLLGRPSAVALRELVKMCRRDKPFTLVIENYSRNIELVKQFCQHASIDSNILLSEKSELHELRAHSLKDAITNRDLQIFELDSMDNAELERIDRLLTLRGLWGERSGLKEHQKQSYLKDDCRRQLHAIMLEVIQSPEIQGRLQKIIDHFDSTEEGSRFLIALCLLQSIGELPRIDVVSELLGYSYSHFKKLCEDEVVRQVIAINSNGANFRSPVISETILKRIQNASTITEVAAICARTGHLERQADDYLGKISVELIRFSNLERILPDRGKHEALQNFYEDMKTIPSINSNALFWLQYAMARLSLGNLELARRYFANAYSIAKETNFDTYQIDNHFCRLLLREAEETEDSDLAFKKVEETMDILKRQVQRENRNYPYRSSWSLEGVTRRHGVSWSASQKERVRAGAKFLIDAATRLDPRTARSISVTGALQRLNRVVESFS